MQIDGALLASIAGIKTFAHWFNDHIKTICSAVIVTSRLKASGDIAFYISCETCFSNASLSIAGSFFLRSSARFIMPLQAFGLK
jgi:Na+-transporting NADH:ubiquinone oxidoreductase subunit NqrD